MIKLLIHLHLLLGASFDTGKLRIVEVLGVIGRDTAHGAIKCAIVEESEFGLEVHGFGGISVRVHYFNFNN
jgi:hypothetical protein